MRVKVVENVLKLNDEIAELNRQKLHESRVFTVNLMGGPGCGKTALLEATLRALKPCFTVGVMVGDLTTTRDADRLAQHSDHIIQINTGKGCHLDANQVRQAMDQMDLDKIDLLFIENVGNLICPVGFDLGQDANVCMFSLPEGDDKPAKHPYIVTEASVLLLNKMDLKAHVAFDMDVFESDIKRLNPEAFLMQIAVHKGRIDHWIGWLRSVIPARKPKAHKMPQFCRPITKGRRSNALGRVPKIRV